MITRALPGLALAAAALGACGLVAFDVVLTEDTVIEGGGTILDELVSLGFAELGGFDMSQSQEFQSRNVNPEDVDSIRMRRLALEIVDPDGVDFSFLSSLEFYLEAPGQPKVRIAHSAPGAFEGTREVELVVDESVELKPYATADRMSLTTRAVANGRPSQDTTVRATVVFHVDPNLGGT